VCGGLYGVFGIIAGGFEGQDRLAVGAEGYLRYNVNQVRKLKTSALYIFSQRVRPAVIE
jgi:hypothetical protein